MVRASIPLGIRWMGTKEQHPGVGGVRRINVPKVEVAL